MSFTEFSYQLLQAYDFYTLHTTQNCTVQVGGQDQWGNIVAGVEMITHLESVTKTTEELQEAKGYGLTTPLLVNSHGHKMGKSEGNAIWLDPQMTSPFDLFQVSDAHSLSFCASYGGSDRTVHGQHFLKTPDADVDKYLKMFTLLSLDRIKMEIDRHEVRYTFHPSLKQRFNIFTPQAEPDKRTAQHLLACEVTEMIHGGEQLATYPSQTLTFRSIQLKPRPGLAPPPRFSLSQQTTHRYQPQTSSMRFTLIHD
jgi:tyrosyl-tRNA synthetase